MGELPAKRTNGTTQRAVTPAEATSIDVGPDSGAAIIAVIERAAQNPAVDIDKMERLLQLQERLFARNAESAFNAAMQAAQAELPQVLRDGTNPQTNSRYAKLETVSKAMNPVITKHGFSMSFGTDVSPIAGHYRITCDVAHIGGHSRRYYADIPADSAGMKGTQNKTATHAFGSSMSYGRRYLKLMIFDVATTNDDDEGNAAAQPGEMLSEEQIVSLDALIDEVTQALNVNRAGYVHRFLAYMKADSLDAIASRDYRRAVDAINSTRRRP